MVRINHLIGKVIAPACRCGVGVYRDLLGHGLNSAGQVLTGCTRIGVEWQQLAFTGISSRQ